MAQPLGLEAADEIVVCNECRLNFRPDGTGTLMTFRQEGFGDVQLRDGYGGGWNGPNGSFEKLDAILARESGAAASRA